MAALIPATFSMSCPCSIGSKSQGGTGWIQFLSICSVFTSCQFYRTIAFKVVFSCVRTDRFLCPLLWILVIHSCSFSLFPWSPVFTASLFCSGYGGWDRLGRWGELSFMWESRRCDGTLPWMDVVSIRALMGQAWKPEQCGCLCTHTLCMLILCVWPCWPACWCLLEGDVGFDQFSNYKLIVNINWY